MNREDFLLYFSIDLLKELRHLRTQILYAGKDAGYDGSLAAVWNKFQDFKRQAGSFRWPGEPKGKEETSGRDHVAGAHNPGERRGTAIIRTDAARRNREATYTGMSCPAEWGRQSRRGGTKDKSGKPTPGRDPSNPLWNENRRGRELILFEFNISMVLYQKWTISLPKWFCFILWINILITHPKQQSPSF